MIDNLGKNTAVKDIDLIRGVSPQPYVLKQLQLSGVWGLGGGSCMKYEFSYNITGNRPDPLTPGIDFMGGIIMEEIVNTSWLWPPDNYASKYVSDPANPLAYRLPDATYAKYGILNSITYPTGGNHTIYV